jgi:hypothetical protein
MVRERLQPAPDRLRAASDGVAVGDDRSTVDGV